MSSNSQRRTQPQQLPWSEEAEKAILGAIFLDSDNGLPKVINILAPRDFYLISHQIIFSAFLELNACFVPIDFITVSNCIKESSDGQNKYKEIGGGAYLTSLTDGLPRATNIEYYANVVIQKSKERRLIFALNNAQNSCLNNGNMEASLSNLRDLIDDLGISRGSQDIVNWRTVSTDNPEDWQNIPPLEWCCEQIIPRNSLGFIGGGPKDGKSVIMLDLMIHMAHAQFLPNIKFLNKFPVHGAKVFYVSKEDGLERLYQRWPDINQSYGYEHVPPGLTIVPRKMSAFMLTEPSHVRWLEDNIARTESNFLCLDVFSELIPGLDEMKEIKEALNVLKDFRDRLNLTIAVIDHTRKAAPSNNGSFKKTNQDLDPMEIRGAFKFGASDWAMMIGTTEESNKVRISIKCKDATESVQTFLIKRSPPGSNEPKHTIESTIEELAEQSRQRGQQTRNQIEHAIPEDNAWHTVTEIAQSTGRAERTVRNHMQRLVQSGTFEVAGEGNRDRRYRRVSTFEQSEMLFEN